MKKLLVILMIFIPLGLFGQKQTTVQKQVPVKKQPAVQKQPTVQKPVSAVEFSGYKNLVLTARKDAMKATGKLNTSEPVKVGCDQGSCFFEIDYKGRPVIQAVGSEIGILNLYEFDFGGDGDFELVAINDYKETAFMFIFSYSRGMIQKLFEKEIKSYKAVIKKDYIELYLPGGQEELWNFYQGQFWKMTPFKSE